MGRRTLAGPVVVAVVAVTALTALLGCGSDGAADAGPTTELPTALADEPGTGADDGEDGDGDDRGDGEDPAPNRVDACAIAETLDLEALLAEPVGATNDASTRSVPACTVAPADTWSRTSMGLFIRTDRGADDFAEQKAKFPSERAPAGLGDAAFRSGGDLFALLDDTMVHIRVVRDSAKGGSVADVDLEAAMATVLEALPA